MQVAFTKMHGIGNDVVVIDARTTPLSLSPPQARFIADRHFGVGCDQIMVIRPSAKADIALTIYNSDGGEVAACGNGTRCVADLILDKNATGPLKIESTGGALLAWRDGAMIAVDMGVPRLKWDEIPLAKPSDTLATDLGEPSLPPAVLVNMGNPHAVHFLPDLSVIDVADLGPRLEHHPIFPERANIEFALIESPNRLRVKVWERGAGITIACGTGACAALVAGVRRGLMARTAEILLDGGALEIEWRADNHVIMRGPSQCVFSGVINLPEGLA